MSKQPLSTDFIELLVEDDGDVILIKRCTPGDQDGPADLRFPVTGGLKFKVGNLKDPKNDRVKELSDELESYGCDIEGVKKAILGVLFGEYNEEVKV